MNWYWPEWNTLMLKVLNKILNYIFFKIWFKIANANIHDEWYSNWWTENDRIRCDTGFLRKMLIDSWWVFYKIFISYLAYFLIRIFWYKYFNFTKKNK